jgi:hypothetical protein
MANINLVNASNGSGEAVRGSVTNKRAVDSTTLIVDSLLNWPQYFIATTGVKDQNDSLDPDSVSVFSGHISGANTITIDSFAPGYEDIGNSVADMVLIKPNTMWADNLAGILNHYHPSDVVVRADETQPSPPTSGLIIWFEDIDS